MPLGQKDVVCFNESTAFGQHLLHQSFSICMQIPVKNWENAFDRSEVGSKRNIFILMTDIPTIARLGAYCLKKMDRQKGVSPCVQEAHTKTIC